MAAIQFETARSSRASSILNEQPEPLEAARTKSDASQPSELFSTKSKNSQTSPISPASLVTPTTPNGRPKSPFIPQAKSEPAPPVHRNPPARFDIPTCASPAPLNPLLAALEDILFGASMTASLPHAAKQAFHAAVKTLTAYHPTDPIPSLRRLRGLIDGEIGLSLLTTPPDAPLARARAHSQAALDLAPRADAAAADASATPPAFARWHTRALLDSVHVTAREGRVLAKRHDELGATEKRRQAFAAAQEILSTLRGATQSAEDDETLARALVTCGRVVRRVGAVVVQQSGRRSGRWSWGWSGGGGGGAGGGGGGGVGRLGSVGGGSVGAVDAEAERTAQEYFQEAMGAVARGLARERAEVEAVGTRVRMVELRSEVKGLLAGNRGGIILPLHALAQEAG